MFNQLLQGKLQFLFVWFFSDGKMILRFELDKILQIRVGIRRMKKFPCEVGLNVSPNCPGVFFGRVHVQKYC